MAHIESKVRTDPDGGVHATLIGKIDEHFDGADVLLAAGNVRRVVLDLGGVRSVTSLGLRALESFLRELDGRELFLDEISAAVAYQLTMIPTLLGAAKVRSARLPFLCPACGAEESASLPYASGAAVSHAPACSACGQRMELDGFAEEYLPTSK